jgi:hypothetical protein
LTCVYSLTEAEKQKLAKLERELGPLASKSALGLKRKGAIVKFFEDHESLPRHSVFTLPPFVVLSRLIDNYFSERTSVMMLINTSLFEKNWERYPILISVLGLVGLTHNGLETPADMVGFAEGLFSHIEQWLRSDADCEGWLKLVVAAYFHLNAAISRHRRDYVLQISREIAREFIEESITRNDAWLKQCSDIDEEDLLIVDVIRRSLHLLATTDLVQLHFGVILPGVPWQLRKVIPWYSSDVWFQTAFSGVVGTEVHLDKVLTPYEWDRIQNMRWLAMPRTTERLWTVRTLVSHLKTFGPLAWFQLCVHICTRACRGDPFDWPGAEYWEPEELEPGSVDAATWTSARHWQDIIDDLYFALPEYIRQADQEGRGEVLLQLGHAWWGPQCAGRLLMGLNLLREARIGVKLRTLQTNRKMGPNDYAADMFFASSLDNSLHDVALLDALYEAILISKIFMGVFQQDQRLHFLPIGVFSQVARAGFLHLILAKRLLRLHQPVELVESTLNDSVDALNLLKAVRNNASMIETLILDFEELLMMKTEPTIVDISQKRIGGLGFWNISKRRLV